jgi:hypothetical protein
LITVKSAAAARRQHAESDQAELTRAGVVAQMWRASRTSETALSDEARKHAIHGRHAPGQRAVVQARHFADR